MLDKMKEHQEAEAVEKGLGVGIRYSCAVGKNRQIEMTAGVPADWSAAEFNSLLDKLGTCMDRQSVKYDLHDLRLALEQTEDQLHANAVQLAQYEANAIAEWGRGQRQGNWKPSNKQTQDITNYRSTDARIRQHIEKLQKDIKDAEAKCR